MLKLFTVLLFVASILSVRAQVMPSMPSGGGSTEKIYDGKISGTVIYAENRTPVEFANIALYKTKSTKPLDGTVTDEKGNFKLKNIKNGLYKVTISFLGFETITRDSVEISDKNTSVDLGNLFVKPASKALKEAVVEGEVPLIETKIDKLVYNADKDLTAKGGDATDILRKVPMVTVDLDGNPSLQGTSNVRVLINNKPSTIMASSVAEALKMIPSDEIEKVEVITSPSAKYDAEGTGGIINIITRKKNVEGLSGSVYAGLGTRSSHLFSNLNYRTGRFGTGINLGGFGYQGHGNSTSTRITGPTTLFQNGSNSNLGIGPLVQWTTDFDITSKNSVSTSLRVRNFYNRTKADIDNTITSPLYSQFYLTNSEIKSTGLNYDANVDYRRTFTKPDQEFSASAQLSNSSRNTDYDVTRDFDGSLLDNIETSTNKNNNQEITFQSDYTHPFSKVYTLETGVKNIIRDVNSDYNYSLFNSEIGYINDTLRSSIFDYSQIVYAGYLQNSVSLKNWGFKAGMRYEQTQVNGDLNKDNTSFKSTYDNWIPTGTISYRKAGAYTYKLSYSRRIQRPGMQYLNPYVNRSDALNISYGNPNLDAETSHSFELGYSLFKSFGSINTSVFHRFTNNAIESIRFIDFTKPQPVYVTTYDNIGRNQSTGLSIGGNVMQGKLMLSSNFNVYYYKVETTDTLSLHNDGINYAVNLFGSYKFNDKWGLQAFGNFNGPKFTVQGRSTSFFYYNLSARREFNNGKGGVGLGIDNFATPYMRFKNDYSGKDFTYTNENKMFFLGARLSIDYRFGKMQFSSPKKKGIKNEDLKEGEDNQQMPGGGR